MCSGSNDYTMHAHSYIIMQIYWALYINVQTPLKRLKGVECDSPSSAVSVVDEGALKRVCSVYKDLYND